MTKDWQCIKPVSRRPIAMNLTGALRTLFVREPADDMAVPESSPETPRSYASAAERIKATGRFEIEDIELLRRTFEQFDFTPGTPWDDFRNSFFSLPEWFHFGLDPLSGDSTCSNYDFGASSPTSTGHTIRRSTKKRRKDLEMQYASRATSSDAIRLQSSTQRSTS